MKNVALHNLGCKVNSYEIDVMQQMLQEKGYNIVPFDEVADIYIVNTCTVTNIADRKSRQMLHRARQKNPDAVVVAVGCYVQTGLESVEKDEAVDLAIGNNKKKDLVPILEEYLQERELLQEKQRDKTLHSTTVLDINHTYEYEEMTLRRTAEHTRAYIKIQDGCNQFCSYCVIPYARGRVRSRRADDIMDEIAGMAKAGYREVVLTGIHISSYGIDLQESDGTGNHETVNAGTGDHETAGAETGTDGTQENYQTKDRPDYSGRSRLIDLIEKIHEIPGIERIRLGSLEPRIVTPDFVKRLAALPKLCPHFHLSLQSGCDKTLRRMNRHYTAEEYQESVRCLREAFDHPAVTTDVIVGFPGESKEEFAETQAFLEKICLYEMHIFKYSRREGTAAAGMPDQVQDSVKTARSNELLSLEKKQSDWFRRRLLGSRVEVLWEEEREIKGRKFVVGHTKDYVKVALPIRESGKESKENTIGTVTVQGFLTGEILLGE